MAVKELFHSEELEAGNNEESTLLQDPYEEEEEEEEALSLCDLPIYSTSAEWSGGDFSKGKKEEENDDNELFEFFSEELTTSTIGSANAENIMFCGKLIPFKSNTTTTTTRSSSEKVQLESKGFEIGKVSLVRSATKSRWFLFMFGMSKLSMNTEMELRDIRKRQSRRVPATMFPAPESGKGKRRGVWKALKSNISMVLGCSSSSKVANDVVRKAAFV